nr:hypothetical protein [Tanacetum cinerariifolium]
MRRVGKGCPGVKTPLFEEPKTDVLENAADDQSIQSPTSLTPLPQQPQDIPSTSQVQSPPPQQQSPPPAQPQVAQDLEILKLKTRVKKLERANKVKTVKLRRLRKVGTSQRIESSDDTLMKDADIYHIDMDHAAKVLSMQEDESEVQEAVEVVTTAKLITEVVAAVSETVSAVAVIPSAAPETISAAAIPTVIAPSIKVAAPVKTAVPSTRRKRGVVIKDPEEESSAKTPTETTSKDKGKGMSYDEIHPIFEAKFNANLEFLPKSKEQIEEEESRAIATINETPAQKVAKRRKLIEKAKEAESIKQHLQIVPDEDDDVFTEATPLARKVPVVDYQIPTHEVYPGTNAKCSKTLSRRRDAAEKNDVAKSSKDC